MAALVVPTQLRGVVLDARWLGRGGVGMTTELTLRALRRLHSGGEVPDGWILRGDSVALAPHRWPGATVEADGRDPHRYLGQRGWTRDDGRLELAFHQFRPLSNRRRLQWLHDAIPLHFARNSGERALRLAYLRRIVATSDALLVDSAHTARCAIEELGASPERLRQITFPVDQDLAAQVAARRSASTPRDRLLFIGRFARHKNVDRLLVAFARTEFARGGGELHLVGGTASEIRQIQCTHTNLGGGVTIEGSVPRHRIIDLLATSTGLIQPSLEEGFGLPVWEARTVGLPVIASTGGSLPELITDPANLFDPLDVEAIAASIDRLTARGTRNANEPVPVGPDLETFGRVVLDGIALALAS